jgi:hypothetical protein
MKRRGGVIYQGTLRDALGLFERALGQPADGIEDLERRLPMSAPKTMKKRRPAVRRNRVTSLPASGGKSGPRGVKPVPGGPVPIPYPNRRKR